MKVQGPSRVDERDLRSLRMFGETDRPRSSIVVCNEQTVCLVYGIRIAPWKVLFREVSERKSIAEASGGGVVDLP